MPGQICHNVWMFFTPAQELLEEPRRRFTSEEEGRAFWGLQTKTPARIEGDLAITWELAERYWKSYGLNNDDDSAYPEKRRILDRLLEDMNKKWEVALETHDNGTVQFTEYQIKVACRMLQDLDRRHRV